jgi:hypothetical protein
MAIPQDHVGMAVPLDHVGMAVPLDHVGMAVPLDHAVGVAIPGSERSELAKSVAP